MQHHLENSNEQLDFRPDAGYNLAAYQGSYGIPPQGTGADGAL